MQKQTRLFETISIFLISILLLTGSSMIFSLNNNDQISASIQDDSTNLNINPNNIQANSRSRARGENDRCGGGPRDRGGMEAAR